MKGLKWGLLYNKYAATHSSSLADAVEKLRADREVENKKGIYEFLLSGQEKFLSLRAFDEDDKITAYSKQKGICPLCGEHFEYDQMQGDHIKPWSKGGKTTPENLQMLCIECNLKKSAKSN